MPIAITLEQLEVDHAELAGGEGATHPDVGAAPVARAVAPLGFDEEVSTDLTRKEVLNGIVWHWVHLNIYTDSVMIELFDTLVGDEFGCVVGCSTNGQTTRHSAGATYLYRPPVGVAPACPWPTAWPDL